MRLMYSQEIQKLQREVHPYIVLDGTTATYVPNTPNEIIEKHKKLKKLIYNFKKNEVFE